jgi:hypothetical protein
MKSWQAEIVRILDNHTLTTTEQESYPYQTHYNTQLDPGHYLVLKMSGTVRQYKSGVVFLGPFVSETQAELVLQSSRYLGLLTGKSAEKTTPRNTVPVRSDDSNLPILLRRQEPHYLASRQLTASKNQRTRAG